MSTNLIYQVIEAQSLGPVQLGLRQGQVRERLSGPLFQKAASTIDVGDRALELPASDYFESSGIKVEYDKAGITNFIEIGPLVPVEWRSLPVFELSCKEVFEKIKAVDPNASMDDSGIYADSIGLAAYAPNWRYQPEQPIELISVYPAMP